MVTRRRIRQARFCHAPDALSESGFDRAVALLRSEPVGEPALVRGVEQRLHLGPDDQRGDRRHDEVEEAVDHHGGERRDRATLGDLADQPFAEIWSSDAYADCRRRLLTDDPPAVCRGCSAYRGLF